MGASVESERERAEDGELSLVNEWSIVPHIDWDGARGLKWIFIHWSLVVHSLLNDKTEQIHRVYAYKVNWTWLCNREPTAIVNTFVSILQHLRCFYQKREKEFILKMCFKTNGNSAINMWYIYHARYLCILNLEFFFYCAANLIKVASQCNLVVPCTILLFICIIVILLHHCLCDCDCDCNL